MKIILTILLLILISFGTTLQVFAVTFEVSTDTKVYTDGKPLFVYVNALPNEIRISKSIVKIIFISVL